MWGRFLNRRGGVPSGAAAFIIIISENIFKYYLNMLIFMGKPLKKGGVNGMLLLGSLPL